MGELQRFLALLLAVAASNAQLIIPKPTLDIESVTSYSIVVNWTMPTNEFYDGFVVDIQPQHGIETEDDPLTLRREFRNLTPGVLYTFIVQATRGRERSDPAVILQDTIPLPPTDLQLEYFDKLVLTLEGPYFQDTEFTVDVPGIEATWEDPLHGVCDCYFGVITPDDGYQAIPGEKDEVVVGTKTRQFIHLTPGKTYTVRVQSSTCGEGHKGALRSAPTEATISLPPSDPSAIVVEEITPTTVQLTWGEPPILGLYDDFEVIPIEEPDASVDRPPTPAITGRNISNLVPCKPYEFEVYTLQEGRRSRNSKRTIIFTSPYSPQSLVATEFTETSISLKWESARVKMENFEGYQIDYLPDDENSPTATTDKDKVMTNLEPGTSYTFSVYSVCLNERRLLSKPVTVSQTTKPERPQFSDHVCQMVDPPTEELKKDVASDLYRGVPWDAPTPSKLSLRWSKPNRGSWDGFVVDYSPYEFEQGASSPAAPFTVAPDTFQTQIEIPIAGYLITTSVRAYKDGILSEPLVKEVQCGDADGEAKRRCKSSLAFWDIVITVINNSTMLRIEIPNYPFHNATVVSNGPVPGVSVFTDNVFEVPNPCQKSTKFSGSHVVVYPICPPELPFCPIVKRNLCTFLFAPSTAALRDLKPNACCGSRFYNMQEAVCCHGKLLEERGFEECCMTRWYSKRGQRCCKPGREPGTSGLVLPGRVSCPVY